MADLTSNAAIDYDLCGTPKVGGGEPAVMAPSFSRRPAQQLPTNEDGPSSALTRGGCREHARHASGEADSDRVREAAGLPRRADRHPRRDPDTPRRQALGNSMAVPVIRWLGERIQAVDEIEVEVYGHQQG